MTAAAELMKSKYPEFLAGIEEFKKVFGSVKREHIKTSVGEWGEPLTGVEVNPVISDKVKNENKHN